LAPVGECQSEYHPVGPPGAGKGTQAQRLVERHGMQAAFHRRHAARRGQGRNARRASGQGGDGPGQLVSDEIVSALIGDELDAMGAGTGAIFDGYPRTGPGDLARRRFSPAVAASSTM
jgi:adenylate kinase